VLRCLLAEEGVRLLDLWVELHLAVLVARQSGLGIHRHVLVVHHHAVGFRHANRVVVAGRMLQGRERERERERERGARKTTKQTTQNKRAHKQTNNNTVQLARALQFSSRTLHSQRRARTDCGIHLPRYQRFDELLRRSRGGSERPCPPAAGRQSSHPSDTPLPARVTVPRRACSTRGKEKTIHRVQCTQCVHTQRKQLSLA
jgi:hypothetical protein